MAEDIKTISPQGESIRGFFNPFRIGTHLWKYRDLIRQLTWREVVGRYKGSFIGMGWSFIQPLVMLCVYTFVFSVIFKARWGVGADEGKAAFALTLFMGLITFSVFSEVANSAPTLVLGNVNYVKKVVFPLEILPLVRLSSVLINALFSLGVLFIGILIINHCIHWTALLLPLIWLPMIIFTLGCGYFLASLGVFVRDMGAVIGVLTTMLFFLTPIFYPIRAVPERLHIVYRMNPLAIFVEDARRVVLWGQLPDWPWFCLGMVFSVAVLMFGFLWFMKSKKAFADVI
jgi:lipopolysaccharide transport system permease protein